jgi:hypothetical protein
MNNNLFRKGMNRMVHTKGGRMKQKILILFLLGGLVLFCGCESKPVEQTNGRTFTIEYDHQVSYDCFVWGTRKVEKAFEQANTTLQFVYDDTLVDSLVKVDSLGRYYFNHVKRDSTGYQALYKGYLCAIKAVCDNNGVKLDTI